MAGHAGAAELGAGAKTRLRRIGAESFTSFLTRGGCCLASPRLRQSLAALGFGYGLNERAVRLYRAAETAFRERAGTLYRWASGTNAFGSGPM